MRLNVDDLRDLVRVMAKQTELPVVVRNARSEEVPWERFDSMSAWETSSLSLGAPEHPMGLPPDTYAMGLNLNREVPGMLSWSPAYGEEGRQRARVIAELLTSQGHARVLPGRWIDMLSIAGMVVLVASWVAVLLRERPDWTVAMVGTLLVATAAEVWRQVTARLRHRVIAKGSGVRWQMKSRAALADERANTRRDWKVGLVVGPLTALAGAVATYLLTGNPTP